MNAAQHHDPTPVEGADASGDALLLALSALADGEHGTTGPDAWLDEPAWPADILSNWHAYQVIGDVLRGHEDPTGTVAASDFLVAFRAGLQAGGVERVADASGSVKRPGQVRGEAANDAVFRWKLLAACASLAAVMAVSWSVLVGSGAGPDGLRAAGAQLASSSADALVTTAGARPDASTPGAPITTATPVAVNTGQGILIRDAQLEALLAEHRQHGGMSALQTPSGFIRNATYDAAER